MSHSEPSKSFGIIPNCSEINPKWQVPEKWACSKPNGLSFSNYAWKSWTVIFHESRFLVYSRTFGLIRNNCGWTIHLEKEKSPFSPRKRVQGVFWTAVCGPRLNVVNIETCIKNLFNEQMFARNMFVKVGTRSQQVISGAEILLTSLVPSSYWEFSRIILKLNVKRAPEMSTIFGSRRLSRKMIVT